MKENTDTTKSIFLLIKDFSTKTPNTANSHFFSALIIYLRITMIQDVMVALACSRMADCINRRYTNANSSVVKFRSQNSGKLVVAILISLTKSLV